ncbi:protease [Sphingomonas sp. Leaf357]|uniref:trypsin-like peptidase domain-containing protein n=1 Tax=Sphingomonas sp. Leaf357 TaxID=1736350 RepID=UPI0006F6E87F|nr:trypsin-like peptidase domain-containing protein [Sphingomonas sp. Leaf357]KQS04234.1 protease [Sphingomonas sp. Leaf357]
MRYAYAITGALLLSGTAATMIYQPSASAQVAQNEPGAIQAAAPKPGAPMSFADMVAKLQPAVVNISTTQKITQQAQPNPFQGTPLGDLFGQMNGGQGGPVTREAQSLGSGFIISPDGYVVTNNHVIAPGAKGATVESIKVIMIDRKEYTAKLIGRDPASDLALLKIDATNLPFVKFGDTPTARVGDWVLAIGNPFGLGSTVTAGIVSALHRATGQPGAYDRFIQTDASINQGNSGGPMFDLNGNVIGINSQIISPTGGSVGIGFAIPAEDAKPVIDTLRKGVAVKRGYLGIGIQPMSEDIASALGLPKDRGEIVSRVEPGEGAAKAGLKQGDVVVRVGGKDVTPDQTLSYLVANTAPGSSTKLDVIRDGKPLSLNATIGTRPTEDQLAALNGGGDDDDGLPGTDDQQNGQVAGANALGVQVVPLTPAIARNLGLDATVQGVVIATVDPSSDAATKGLKRGDVIVSVNRVPTRTAADVATAIGAAKAAGRDQVLIFLQRPRGASGFLAIKIKK